LVNHWITDKKKSASAISELEIIGTSRSRDEQREAAIAMTGSKLHVSRSLSVSRAKFFRSFSHARVALQEPQATHHVSQQLPVDENKIPETKRKLTLNDRVAAKLMKSARHRKIIAARVNGANTSTQDSSTVSHKNLQIAH
jgi:hypothetical protein